MVRECTGNTYYFVSFIKNSLFRNLSSFVFLGVIVQAIEN